MNTPVIINLFTPRTFAITNFRFSFIFITFYDQTSFYHYRYGITCVTGTNLKFRNSATSNRVILTGQQGNGPKWVQRGIKILLTIKRKPLIAVESAANDSSYKSIYTICLYRYGFFQVMHPIIFGGNSSVLYNIVRIRNVSHYIILIL